MDERRRFERMRLSETAQILVISEEGRRLGTVRALGAAGMIVETREFFAEGSPHHLLLVDEAENIRLEVTAVTRQLTPEGVNFDFRALSVEAAVEIGFLVGKYRAARRSAAA